MLYIFRFLHQTTTLSQRITAPQSCISFVSYIKPQQHLQLHGQHHVVYLSFPTSNHNLSTCSAVGASVVYLSFPTSNHNFPSLKNRAKKLYIFRFLHQTTTPSTILLLINGCISFVSYIKPQLQHSNFTDIFVVYLSFPTSNHNYSIYRILRYIVVYLSFPTSNHNALLEEEIYCMLYIFRFLHQTTTMLSLIMQIRSCISFVSYIKPQL